MSHPGLVVSEGSAVFSSLRAVGLTGERRLALLLTDVCAPPALGGDGPLTHFIFQRQGLGKK